MLAACTGNMMARRTFWSWITWTVRCRSWRGWLQNGDLGIARLAM